MCGSFFLSFSSQRKNDAVIVMWVFVCVPTTLVHIRKMYLAVGAEGGVVYDGL